MDHILDKIKKIEALIEGATTKGEKDAAISAKERILQRHPDIQIHHNAVEYKLMTSDAWQKRLLLALCRKYGLEPYRYKRQKYTTVMVRVNPDFLQKVLWKEYKEYSTHLFELVSDVTDSLISKIHQHEDEAVIKGELKG